MIASPHLRQPPFLCILIFVIAFASSAPAETYQNWITAHFTAPQIAAGMAAPSCDHDQDSCPNILEYFGGTLPLDRTSAFSAQLSTDQIPGQVTVSFSGAPGRTDLDHTVLVSNDLLTWSDDAVFVCHEDNLMYHLNGYRFARIEVRPKPGVFIDTDEDGLLDFFEESLLATDPGDAFQTLADILPGDDFDGDGTPNIDEAANTATGSGTFTKPAFLDPFAVACAADEFTPPSPAALLVHTLLQ